MPPVNPWKSYRQIATQTAPPGQLVLMLFDGAIRSLDRALIGFDSTEIGERNLAIHNNLERAVEIIRELNSSLDLESGGQLAETLQNLYEFFDKRLMESNLKKSRKGIDEVMPMLKQLRDAWAGMLNRQTLDIESAATQACWSSPQLVSA
jgi:flagellar secretion chaperone FliS